MTSDFNNWVFFLSSHSVELDSSTTLTLFRKTEKRKKNILKPLTETFTTCRNCLKNVIKFTHSNPILYNTKKNSKIEHVNVAEFLVTLVKCIVYHLIGKTHSHCSMMPDY